MIKENVGKISLLASKYTILVKYQEISMKRKKDKKNLTFRTGDLNPRFSGIFPTMI
jgi:hypothetical protein